MLKPPGQTSVAWAVFDAAWYLARYPDVREELGEEFDDAAVLRFYLDYGQARAHSPNLWFDEPWHMKQHLGAAAAVRDGHAQSAFDSYCRGGFRYRSPHWLFSESLYRQRYRDLTDEVLAKDGHANGYDHYLKHGTKEDRSGHWLFDPAFYRAQLAARPDDNDAFGHYLRHIEGRGPERRTSLYFNPLWYLNRYPAVGEGVAQGLWRCALHHYLTNDSSGEFDPLPEFSEAYYRSRNPDVAKAVEARDRRNGYDHFIANGATELRAPNQWIDLRWYVNSHPSVRVDLELRRARDAFSHYLAIGRVQGLAPSPPPEDQVSEQQANALFRRKAEALLPTANHVIPDFTCSGTPAVSVVMVLRDGFAQTLLTLAGLRANYPGDMQLMLVGCGTTGETAELARAVRGAQWLRFDSDVGFINACNAALNCVTADAVLLLGNEVELAPGAVATALRRLAAEPTIGAVGGRLVAGHGLLREAGGIVWRDGVVQPYLRDASPTAPEANFVRDVDFCGSDFLLLRTALLQELEGLDEELDAKDYAAADICVRIAGAGHRVVYDPAIIVQCHGRRPVGALADTASDKAQQRFSQKHINHLRFRYIADRRVEVFARCTSTARRVLFIDDTIPMRMIGSGFVRSTDIIQVMASLGQRVTVYPMNTSRFGLASVYADMPDTVEVMHDRAFDGLADFLAGRQGYYDAIWIARTHNLDRVKPLLERLATGAGRPPRIVLDTEAIASQREAARATLAGDLAANVDAAIMQEFANAVFCQSIIAVNPDEAQKLRDLGFSDVAVIGHLREARPTPRRFADRAGLLFVGAMHQPDSPNYDGLVWFIEKVLPLVEQSLGWETRLTVAGYVGETVSLEQYRDHPRITLRGAVANTEPLYDAHRIFVAPTRYAAGTPYKVHEAASFGLPVVATDLLRRQLGWRNGSDLLSANTEDPAEFARVIVTLYHDAALWQTLRDNALARIRSENNREDYAASIRKVLEG